MIEGVANGPSPLPVQAVPSSELYVFYAPPCLMGPQIAVIAECKMAYDGWQAERERTTRSNKRHADLRRLIWARIEDAGVLAISVFWMPSRVSKAAAARQ